MSQEPFWHRGYRSRVPPLIQAAWYGRLERIRRLLAAGDDPNVRDEDGISPVRAALMANRLDALRLLLSSGADPNERDARGTVLEDSAGWHGIEPTRELLAAGADPNTVGCGPYRYSALMWAARRRGKPSERIELVRMLIAVAKGTLYMPPVNRENNVVISGG